MSDTSLVPVSDWPLLTPIEHSNLSVTDLNRLKRSLKPVEDQHHRHHLLWTGPVRPDTGVPFLHRFDGQKNVSATRLLWKLARPDSPIYGEGRLRRLDSCGYADQLCVHPGCFELASTPLEPQSLPDYYSQPVRLSRSLGPDEHRWWKVPALEGVQDRYVYRHETFDLRCPCRPDCKEMLKLPMCPNGHVLDADWTRTPDGIEQMAGNQYRCRYCTRQVAAAKKLRGSRPRPGFRPASPTHNNTDQEYELLMAQIRTIPGSGQTIGPGVDAQYEREMQAMEADIRRGRKPTRDEWNDEPVADGEDDMTYEQAMKHRGWPDEQA